MMIRNLAALLATVAALSAAPEYRAGAASVDITPELPFWLTGFAARTRPADKVTLPLHAKALAIEDGRGGRVVIITADLLGVTREITIEVALRLAASHKLRRDQILFNASHTHSGPSVWPRLHLAPTESPEANKQVEAYGRRLIDAFTTVADQALRTMQPADIEFGLTEATFAKNRRPEHLAKVRPGRETPAPVDRSVPVLRVIGSDGHVRAVLFGYACHNTVLTQGFTEVNGDYAGYAQQALERALPGAKAMFVTLCAGDQRAEPRGTRELAQQYGETLAHAVATTKLRRVTGSLRTAYEEIRLPFQAHTREAYESESRSADFFAARRGKTMLAAFDAGHPVLDTAFPVSAIAFGSSVGILALGGEPVVDYALRLKKDYPNRALIVAGYSNDVMGYIPTLRIQREGGYEAGDAMMYYIQPGWFTEEVEPLVLGAARRMLAAVGF